LSGGATIVVVGRLRVKMVVVEVMMMIVLICFFDNRSCS
jgi:hypothetical protein